MKILLVAFTTFALTMLAAQAGTYPDISIAELKKVLEEKKSVVIDNCGTAAWKAGHIPTAINFEACKSDLLKFLPKDKRTLIVVYGGPTYDEHYIAGKKIEALGYTNLKHFSAGVESWEKAGEKSEPGK